MLFYAHVRRHKPVSTNPVCCANRQAQKPRPTDAARDKALFSMLSYPLHYLLSTMNIHQVKNAYTQKRLKVFPTSKQKEHVPRMQIILPPSLVQFFLLVHKTWYKPRLIPKRKCYEQ